MNVKVKEIGDVHPKKINYLLRYYREENPPSESRSYPSQSYSSFPSYPSYQAPYNYQAPIYQAANVYAQSYQAPDIYAQSYSFQSYPFQSYSSSTAEGSGTAASPENPAASQPDPTYFPGYIPGYLDSL